MYHDEETTITLTTPNPDQVVALMYHDEETMRPGKVVPYQVTLTHLNPG